MKNELSCAEAMDLMNSRIAIGFLLASLTYALDASMFLLAEPDNQLFKWIGFSISILAVLWIFRAVGPGLYRKFKNRSFTHQEPESFVTESFHKAIIKSWILTILILMVLKVFDQQISQADLPAEFYINALVFIMLFSASLVFLVMTHASDDSEHEVNLNQ